MAKITVTASEDFFDGANQIPRKKGDEFVLKAEYAKSLGKQVSIVEKKEPVKTPKQERKEVISKKAVEYNSKNKKASPVSKMEIVEKVKRR